MFAESFNRNTFPYVFNTSNDLASFYIPSAEKSALRSLIASGREGIVYKDSIQFYFTVGDIKEDGNSIEFIQIPDTIRSFDLEKVNQYLKSEQFILNNNSDFTYSVQYGITDSVAVSLLTDGKYINYKLTLVDDVSGDVLGEFDNITFEENNVTQFANIAYQVNTNGIGNRMVRLNLTIENNFESSYTLNQKYADEEIILGKQYRVQQNLSEKFLPNEYSLSQNYPNPFNPITTIQYQLPQDGFVTLKVYDILGREVANLVNEQKSVGRYNINFSTGSLGNASQISSGVYIYKVDIKGNDGTNPKDGSRFSDIKKMMLLK